MTRKICDDTQTPISRAGGAFIPPPSRILRLKEVCKIVGLGRSFVYRLQAENRFPQSIKIGLRAVGWLEEEVRNWVAERIADSRRDKPDVR
jgi:prophage regulatory protein